MITTIMQLQILEIVIEERVQALRHVIYIQQERAKQARLTPTQKKELIRIQALYCPNIPVNTRSLRICLEDHIKSLRSLSQEMQKDHAEEEMIQQ